MVLISPPATIMCLPVVAKLLPQSETFLRAVDIFSYSDVFSHENDIFTPVVDAKTVFDCVSFSPRDDNLSGHT